MADSLYKTDRKCIFREEFTSEQSVRKNGGVPSNVTFEKGKVSFNGSSSLLTYNNINNFGRNTEITIRLNINILSTTGSEDGIINKRNDGTFRQIGKNGWFIRTDGSTQLQVYYQDNNNNYDYLTFSSSILLDQLAEYVLVFKIGTSISLYVNGVLKETKAATTSSVGQNNSDNFVVGKYLTNYAAFNGDLLEIYNYAFSAQEVKNLYENKRYRDLDYRSDAKEILNVNAQDGIIRNKYSGNTINGNLVPSVINTDTEVFKLGNTKAMKFNGSTSNIDCGSYDTLIGDKTFIAWVNHTGAVTVGTRSNIFSNGSLNIWSSGFSSVYRIAMDNNGTGHSITSSTFILRSQQGKWQNIIITRTSAGVGNIYIDGVLSGDANQAGDTPVAGIGNIIIGSSPSGGRYFDGLISNPRIIDGILTAQEIAQIYSSEKHLYNK